MKAILLWLASPEWGQIVKALLHSLWQGGVLAVLLGLALRRMSAPSLRYRLALGSLGALLLATVLTWAVLSQIASRPGDQTGKLPPGPASALQIGQQLNVPDEALVVTVAGTRQLNFAAPPMQWTAWTALVWLLGAVLMLTRAGIQVAGAERLRRSGKPLADRGISQLLAETQRAVRLVRKIRVTVTDTLTSPAVVGVLVPTLILPLSLVTTLTHEQLRFVLLHELAHIRRGDYFANLFQLFVEALLFFNPAVWWISQQVRREREACCDAVAIELSGAPAEYARTLVHVAESALNPSPAAAAAFGNKQREPSSLSDRVQRLLVPGYRPALRLTWRAMLISLVVGGTLLVLSALGTRNTVGAILADKNAPNSPADASSQATISTGQTKRLAFSDGREAINNRLDQIRLDRVHFKRTPLSDVIRILTQEAKNRDPERKGINFVLNSRPLDTVDQDRTIGTVTIVIDPPLTNLSLAELTEVIIMVASQPISYSIEDFGVLFSLGKTPESLVSRRIKVNPATFSQRWLDRPNYVDAPPGTNRVLVAPPVDSLLDHTKHPLHRLFTEAGIDMQPPKTFFYKDRTGELFVRATPEEIERLTRLLAETRTTTHLDDTGTNAPALVQSARLLLEAGKPDEAEAKLKAALDAEPENQAGPYYLSYIKESRIRNAKGGQVVSVSREGSDGVQTAAGKLYSRRFKVDPQAFEQGLGIQWVNGEWWFPSKTNAHEGFIEAAETAFAKVGVDLKPPKLIYYKNRTGELLIRATQEDLDRLTPFLGQFDNRTRPNSHGLREQNGLPAPPTQDEQLKAELAKTSEADESPSNLKPSELRQLSNKVPVLGELPLIGKLFPSSSNEQSGAAAVGDQLHVRRYKVDPNTFTKNLEGATAHQARPTNVVAAVRDFFGNFGVDLKPPKNIYFNDRAGELFVRATLQDLDVIEEALQALNAPTPQVNIKVRFVEVDSQNGFDWFIGNILLTATNSATVGLASQFSGILTEPQYRVVLRAMEERKDAKVLAMQEVTTSSGQQAQIQTVELMTVVNGMNLTITARPGHAASNSSTNTAYQTQVLPFGAVLDVIPSVAADGYTIQMTLLPTVTEFLGYDDPAKVLPGLRNRKLEGELPLSRVRVRQISMSANVWDGQTLFLGTASEEILSKKTDGSVERNASRDAKKQLLIFITPTIIDQAGNRMHAGDALPIERTTPPQTPRN